MSNDIKISSSITVGDCKRYIQEKNKEKICSLFEQRFKERYIQPFKGNENKHGFSIMAISCLMIEALESFKQGWPNSNSRSALAFSYFFDTSIGFKEMSGHHQAFYKHVRCGLLHQAETTGGWRIVRKGNFVFQPSTLTINATKFHQALEKEFDLYIKTLKQSDMDSSVWKSAIVKLKHTCKVCAA